MAKHEETQELLNLICSKGAGTVRATFFKERREYMAALTALAQQLFAELHALDHCQSAETDGEVLNRFEEIRQKYKASLRQIEHIQDEARKLKPTVELLNDLLNERKQQAKEAGYTIAE